MKKRKGLRRLIVYPRVTPKGVEFTTQPPPISGPSDYGKSPLLDTPVEPDPYWGIVGAGSNPIPRKPGVYINGNWITDIGPAHGVTLAHERSSDSLVSHDGSIQNIQYIDRPYRWTLQLDIRSATNAAFEALYAAHRDRKLNDVLLVEKDRTLSGKAYITSITENHELGVSTMHVELEGSGQLSGSTVTPDVTVNNP